MRSRKQCLTSSNKGWLTKRAPDWWGRAAKMGLHLAQAGSVKAASSRPTHQRVTQTVSWFLQIFLKEDISDVLQ